MIYVPDLNYKCYVVQSEGVIRAYEETPQYNTEINYRDYYINSSYIYKDGRQSFGSYSSIPTCLNTSVLTNDFYYRLDLDSILIIFTIFVIFGIGLPFKILFRLFRRFN